MICPSSLYLLSFLDGNVGNGIRNLTEVKGDYVHCSPLVDQASRFIVEGSQ